MTYIGDKLVRVRDIDEVCDNLKELFAAQKRANEKLIEENNKLLNEHYKDNKLLEKDEELLAVKIRLSRSFEVTAEQWGAIRKWQEDHREKYPSHTDWTYEFLPTGIGTVGYCKCNKCGEKFEFAGL